MSLVSTPAAALGNLSRWVPVLHRAIRVQACAAPVSAHSTASSWPCDSIISYAVKINAPACARQAMSPSSNGYNAAAVPSPTANALPAQQCSLQQSERLSQHLSRMAVRATDFTPVDFLQEQLHSACKHQHQHTYPSSLSGLHQIQQPPYSLTSVTQHVTPAHTRGYASSSSMLPDPLSQQLLSCKGLGALRRIMLKYKANMGPEQVANTLLSLQHLVLQARQQYGGQRQSMPHPAEEEFQHEQMLRRFNAHGQPRVRAAQSLGPATTRVLERDGPMEQLTSQVLGELGNMIWHYLEDMSGPDLAKLLYSWAKLSWHPESQLLADVTASFHAAASTGRGQHHSQSGAPNPPLHRGPREPWLAAGLWGLCKVEQPLSVPSLKLLLAEWQKLMRYWRPQQLVDVVWAVAAVADEQTAAEAAEPELSTAEGGVQDEQLQLAVLGLAKQHLEALQQLGSQKDAAGAPVWPESLLPAQQCTTTVQRHHQQHVGSNDMASARGQVWRLLQAVVAVGVDVSEPPPGHVAELVKALNEALQPQTIVWR